MHAGRGRCTDWLYKGAIMAEADPREKVVPVAELRAHLRRYLKKVEDGASFVIVSRGKRVAVLAPDEPDTALSRAPGAMKGQIRIIGAFDDPLPDDVLDAFEADL